ncbi:MAG: hypothetical protein ACI4D5_00445 [Kineothrix sp.]
MDKYEYKVRAEEIKSLIAEGEFAEAVKIADTIDWRRVKSVMMLCTISDLYKINRRFQESKDVLLMAYERHPNGRLIVYSLCELSIKMGEFVQAVEYYKEFVQIAPRDTGKYILQYKLYEAQDVSLEERIAVLEEFKKRDYREKWAYELAYLYHRVGLETRCVEECDEIFLWFGEGRYVLKALELKLLHQPLTDVQQKKYLNMKQGNEPVQEGIKKIPAGAEEDPAGRQPELYKSDMNHKEGGTQPGEYQQPAAEGPEEGIRVKTIDLGQCNTMNLQEVVAESMKELMEVEEAPVQAVPSVSAGSIHPFQQEDYVGVSGAAAIAGSASADPSAPVEPAAAHSVQQYVEADIAQEQGPAYGRDAVPEVQEEVFFEEEARDILLEDTKEISIQELQEGSFGDTREMNLKRRTVYPFSGSSERSPVQGGEQALEPEAEEREPAVQKAIGPMRMPAPKPSGFEQMLSQEYDGQISLVVPSKNGIEKQITGQMNIAEIMTEWERIKEQNEEKRRQDVRKRVQQHTGNMFSEFDEAARAGVLEQLQKASEKAIMEEAGLKAETSDEVEIKELEELIAGYREKLNKLEGGAENKRRKQKAAEQTPAVEEAADESGSMQEAQAPPESVERTEVSGEEADTEEEPLVSQAEREPGTQDLVKAIREELEEHSLFRGQEKAEETAAPPGSRVFSEEEKELFGQFISSRQSREQILAAMETMGLDSCSGNVIITGEEGSGTIELAKRLVHVLQTSDSNFSGKVARVSADTLNKKDVRAVFDKLTDGALIVEHASDISHNTAADLSKILAEENRGLFLILEDQIDEMNAFLEENQELADHFDARIDVDSLDDRSLVEYARQYAEKNECSIDELGVLALHTRIADMQTSDHEVTVAEVKDLVDDAIYFARKKNLKHFFDILLGKRYDEEDMIILREKDFMH